MKIFAENIVNHYISETEYRALPIPSYSSLKSSGNFEISKKMLIGAAIDKYVFDGIGDSLEFCQKNKFTMAEISIVGRASGFLLQSYKSLLSISEFQKKITADLVLEIDGDIVSTKPFKSMLDIFCPSLNAVVDLKCIFEDNFHQSISFFDYAQQLNAYAIMSNATSAFVLAINPISLKHQLISIELDQKKHCEKLINYLLS